MAINMGGNSTLHSTVSSDSVETQEKFDLKSWQGLTELLKAGKNALKPEVYAEFRNLVLSYAQHGGDAEYKKRIDDVVATFGRSPVTSLTEVSPFQDTKEKATESNRVQNSRRIVPIFGDAPVAPSPSLPVPEVVAIPEPIPVQEPVPVEASVPEPIIDVPEVSTPEPVSEQALPPVAPVLEIPLPPVATLAPEPVVVTPPPAPAEVPQPPKQPDQLQNEQVPFMTLEQYKVRIAEIKRAVNTHFGNPVALMAVPNNLGKVYMTALLSALKATTPGAPGGVGNTMAELERAFKTLIEGDMVAPITSPKASEPTPEPIPPAVEEDPIKEPEPQPVVASSEIPLPPAPIPEPNFPPVVVEPVLPIPELVNKGEVVSEPKSIPVPETPSLKDTEHMSILERIESEQGLPPLGEHTEASRSEEMHSAFEKTDKTISTVVGSVHKKLNPLPDSIADLVAGDSSGYESWAQSIETESQHTTDTDPIAVRENKWTKKGVGEENKKDALEQQGINTDEVQVKQTELYSPQISSALDKLLHEWTIFGGSGFFGMGPGGVEHPLFKNLAPLSMGEVVAGRFDNADPKVIKVIKQYVDAWRHEQGITYTTNETFEHYLRRVVQRIFKRQSA